MLRYVYVTNLIRFSILVLPLWVSFDRRNMYRGNCIVYTRTAYEPIVLCIVISILHRMYLKMSVLSSYLFLIQFF
jgi:hypothetical protein